MDNSWWGPIDDYAWEKYPPRRRFVHNGYGGVRRVPVTDLDRAVEKAHEERYARLYDPFWDSEEDIKRLKRKQRGRWQLSDNVMNPKDAFRFKEELRPTEYVCKVHWGHLENGKPKYPRLHPAVAIWNGRWYLCEDALNHWLDNADDDPSLEPERLVFL